MGQSGRIKILSLSPTVFFAREGSFLKQMVDIGVGGPGSAADVSLKAAFEGHEFEVLVGEVGPGKAVHRLAIPDIRESGPVRFALYAGGELQDERKVSWTPGKHWHVYLVQAAHHDLGYTDLPSNVLREYEGFYDDVLRFCRETDDYPEDAKFRYVVEQAWSLLHYLEHRPPEVVGEMVRRIMEGRVEVTALFGNQTSEIHGPEELIRALYPAFRLKRKYGIPIATAELNDVPGLSWGLCLALAGAGVRYFAPALPTYFDWHYHVHGFWDESRVLPNGGPDAFWWEAPDGEKVLFWYGATGAGGSCDPLLPELAKWLKEAEDRGYPYDMVRYWVMGGHRDNPPPLMDFANTARAWNEKWAYPHLICGTSAQFFEHLAGEIGPDVRTLRGELPGTDYPVGANSTACETAVNRVTHDALLAAERFATVAAAVSDYPYPAETLAEAYDAALLYDEHTWGQGDPSGPAQAANWAQKAELAYRAAALTQDVTVKALNKIVDQVRLDGEGHNIVVFNPLPAARTDLVQAQMRPPDPCSWPMRLEPRSDGLEGPGIMWASSVLGRGAIGLPDELTDGKFDLVDAETGRKVPFQIVRMAGPRDPVPGAAHQWAMGHMEERRLCTICFIAEDVPALGHRAFRVVPRGGKPDFGAGVQVGKAALESRFYKVTLDPKTGAVASVYDKELGRELLDAGAPHKLNQVIVRSAQTHEEYEIESVAVSKGQVGPISGSLVVTGTIRGCPQVTQEITLYGDLKRIDLATRLLKDSMSMQEIYIAFPFDIPNPEFKYESALSIIEPLVDQFPGSNTDYYAVQHWANVSGGGLGITWASQDAAMAEFGGLWPGYVSQAHHGIKTPGFGHEFLKPGELEKAYIYSYVLDSNFCTNFQPVQMGEVLFRYSITSGPGGWRDGRARDFGWGVSLPMENVVMTGPKDGSLPATQDFCRVDAPNVVLLALKRAEDGDGLILRLWEIEGRDTEAEVHLPLIRIEKAWETNLVEENLRGLPSPRDSLSVPIKASGVAAVRIRAAG